jgi:hypothetical protein
LNRWRQGTDVAARRVDDRVVLVNLQTNHIYSLNATGSRLWELLEAGRTRDELVAELGQEFGVSSETVEQDVDRLLAELEQATLVVGDG